MRKSTTTRFCIIIGLLCAVSGLRCAYLNCFYNAKTAFNIAHKAHVKLQHEGADTTEILPEEIAAGYDRAIAKSTKLLDLYPKRKKWHDDALFLRGKATYYKKEYAVAIRRLRQYQKEFPASPFIPESYLLLGKAYLGDNNLEKAEETFELVLQRYPDLNSDEEVTLLLAEVAIRREGKSQAVRILEESLRSIKSEEKKMKIILDLCALYLDLNLYEKVVGVLENAPRNKKYQSYLFQIDYYLLVCYTRLNRYAEALDFANALQKNKNYLKYMARIVFEKAMILKEMDRIEETVAVLNDIVLETHAPEIQGRAWFELGLIHQHHYGDFVKAQECYEKALSLLRDDALTQIAHERIQGIQLKNQYHEEIRELAPQRKNAGDSSALYRTRYQLAEVYWINLSETDSALIYFGRIAADTSADTAVYVKALYASAWLLRFVKKDTVAADSIYRQIVDRYPATLIAKKSQQDLGVPVTVQTRGDSAQQALIEAERIYFNDRDPVAAVNQYYHVAKAYHDIEEIASVSIFAAAWLCDKVLNKNKTAYTLYKKLCDDFPETALCISEAQPRIKIVEDTLRAIEAREKAAGAKKSAEKRKPAKKKAAVQDSLLAPDENGVLQGENQKTPAGDTTVQIIDNLNIPKIDIEIDPNAEQ